MDWMNLCFMNTKCTIELNLNSKVLSITYINVALSIKVLFKASDTENNLLCLQCLKWSVSLMRPLLISG